jgi:RNA polymerase sigma-70 factor (ECF subfamily)
MSVQTDEQLVRLARGGDKAAFARLFEHYLPMVQRVTRRMIADVDSAHDLAQEALLQAYLSLHSLQADDRFRSWLYGITLNVCRAYIRSQRANVYSLEAMLGGSYREPDDNSPTPEEIIERLEVRQWVMDAVESLSPANRAAVLLFYYESFSLRETASLLGISVVALKGRLHKARRHLANRLPMHQPLIVAQEARKMIPVKLVDVMRQTPKADSGESLAHMQVILLDEAGSRALVIWVGEVEGMAIAMGLSSYDTPRPMTLLFMSRLLEATGASLDSVHISALKDEVYYATVQIRTGERMNQFDARPSDAMALAVQVKAPIYVSEDVMQRAGQPIPSGQRATGKGLAAVLEHLGGRLQQAQEQLDELKAQPPAERTQKITEMTQAVLAEVFTTGS